MTPAEFSKMLCEWRARCAWSDAQAAAELGCAYGTLRHWLRARIVPGYFAMCAVVRQMREGHDPLTDVRMTPAEFARLLKQWRVQHRFSQRQAARGHWHDGRRGARVGVEGWHASPACPW